MSKLAYSSFVSRRLLTKKGNLSTAGHMLNFTVAAVALCTAVVLLTLFIGEGFKKGVKRNVSLLTGDLYISPYADEEKKSDFFVPDKKLMDYLAAHPKIKKVATSLKVPGLLKSDSSFIGILAIGLSSDDYSTISRAFGTEPIADSVFTQGNALHISAASMHKLGVHRHAPLFFYTLSDKLRIRPMVLRATSDIPEVSFPIAFIPIDRARNLCAAPPGSISSIEIYVKNGVSPEDLADELVVALSNKGLSNGAHLGISTAKETYPPLYEWLDMLDGNMLLLIIIMAIVASFTVASGALILILDRTYMIGVLKALGADNHGVRMIFMWLGARIVGHGLLWGNLLAFFVAGAQLLFHFITLDSSVYYISYVPIYINPYSWVLCNLVGFFFLCCIILLPTEIISKISPVNTLYFD